MGHKRQTVCQDCTGRVTHLWPIALPPAGPGRRSWDEAVRERTGRLGIRDSGLGIRDSGSGIRDPGLGIRDPGSGIRYVQTRTRLSNTFAN